VVQTSISTEGAGVGSGGGSGWGSEAALPGHDRETRIAVGLHQKGLLDRELADAAYCCRRGCRCLLSSYCVFFRLEWTWAGALYPYSFHALYWFVVSLFFIFFMNLFYLF
jgi:hypothetical protein